MKENRKDFLSVTSAKELNNLFGINIFTDFRSDIEYETDELKNKIVAYAKAKRELEDFLLEPNKEEEMER